MTATPDTPQRAPDKSGAREGKISLRFKFILTLAALSLLPFVFIVLHITAGYENLIRNAVTGISNPYIRTALLEGATKLEFSIAILATTFFVLIAIGVYVSEKFFIGEIRTLLTWLRDAREKGFTQLAAAPLTSGDELGQLGEEIQQAIVHFQEIGERERKIAEQKTEFISVAAHQLRTPLTGLRWGIETVVSEKTTPEVRAKTSGNLYAAVERMINLVDDLLNVAKLEEGKFDYHFETIDIIPAIKRLFDHFTLIAQSRAITIEFKAPPSAQIYADPVRMEIVLSNLISNALNYTSEGGTVTIIVEDKGQGVAFSVQDSGIGIPAAHIPKLFEKFSRAENAVRMRPDGSGLGLYIAHNIIEKHGSNMKVASEEGKGSTFSFSIDKNPPSESVKRVSVDTFFQSF